MNNPKQQLSHAQRKLIDSFIANAGLEYVGKRFSLSRRGKNKTRYFSCERVEFAQEISDSELLSLAQQGYLQVYADPPSVIFIEKTIEEPDTPTQADSNSGRRPVEPHWQVLKVDIIQVYAWLIASLIAAGASFILFIVAIQQVLNQNVAVGVLSGLSTIGTAFVTTIFFKNYDKANDRLQQLRSNSSTTGREDRSQ